MEVWQILLYGTASVLALRTLTGLMMAHKQRLLAEIAAEEERARRELEAKKKAEKEQAARAAKRRNLPGAAVAPAAKPNNAAA